MSLEEGGIVGCLCECRTKGREGGRDETLILLSSLLPVRSFVRRRRYTGMAIRVVQDLGMQHEISLAPHVGEPAGGLSSSSVGGTMRGGGGSGGDEREREEIARRRLLFWAVFLLDRFISWGTGCVDSDPSGKRRRGTQTRRKLTVSLRLCLKRPVVEQPSPNRKLT